VLTATSGCFVELHGRSVHVQMGLVTVVKVIMRWGQGLSLSTLHSPVLGATEPLIQGVSGVKRQGHEADHLSPSSAEVNTFYV
jgi:hypothetical protein